MKKIEKAKAVKQDPGKEIRRLEMEVRKQEEACGTQAQANYGLRERIVALEVDLRITRVERDTARRDVEMARMALVAAKTEIERLLLQLARKRQMEVSHDPLR